MYSDHACHHDHGSAYHVSPAYHVSRTDRNARTCFSAIEDCSRFWIKTSSEIALSFGLRPTNTYSDCKSDRIKPVNNIPASSSPRIGGSTPSHRPKAKCL